MPLKTLIIKQSRLACAWGKSHKVLYNHITEKLLQYVFINRNDYMQKEKMTQFKYGRILEVCVLLLLSKKDSIHAYSSNLEFVQVLYIWQFKTQ